MPATAIPRAAAVALLFGLGGVVGCSRPDAPVPPKRPPEPRPISALPSPLPPPALGRAELLTAVRTAADAYARGTELEDGALIGRRFSMRLPFGCGDEADPPGAAVEVEPRSGRTTLRVAPQSWGKAAWLPAPLATDGSLEAIEGFWIRRPWTTSDSCPPRAPGPDPETPRPAPPRPSTGRPDLGGSSSAAAVRETVGLAQLRRRDEPRTARHTKRPYETRLKAPDGAPADADHRFWLVLEGRITSLTPEGAAPRAIACRAPDPDHRPVCLIGVEVDHVAMVRQANGETVATWDP